MTTPALHESVFDALDFAVTCTRSTAERPECGEVAVASARVHSCNAGTRPARMVPVMLCADCLAPFLRRLALLRQRKHNPCPACGNPRKRPADVITDICQL